MGIRTRFVNKDETTNLLALAACSFVVIFITVAISIGCLADDTNLALPSTFPQNIPFPESTEFTRLEQQDEEHIFYLEGKIKQGIEASTKHFENTLSSQGWTLCALEKAQNNSLIIFTDGFCRASAKTSTIHLFEETPSSVRIVARISGV